jgi:aerobic-type carbon monoxide dehydrogenase small subunit (CoxS/CutS family)
MTLLTVTVNGMSKTSKNHPQTMAHHNLFNRQSYTGDSRANKQDFKFTKTDGLAEY